MTREKTLLNSRRYQMEAGDDEGWTYNDYSILQVLR
jgi:hypothetical protein